MRLIDIDDTTPTQPATDLQHTVQSDANFVEPRTLSLLDGAMNDILNRYDIPDSEKWMLYNQTLQKFLNYMKKTRSQDALPNTYHTSPQHDQRNQYRSMFDGHISENSLSGINPIRDSIDLISPPAVRNFFQQAKENAAKSADNNSYQQLSPILAPQDSPTHLTPSQMGYDTQQTPHQSQIPVRVRGTATKSKQSPQRRAPKRNAQNITSITNQHRPKARREKIEPRPLFRTRNPTRSNHDFYWQPTQAK